MLHVEAQNKMKVPTLSILPKCSLLPLKCLPMSLPWVVLLLLLLLLLVLLLLTAKC